MNVLLSSAANKIPLLQALEAAALSIDSKIKVIAGDISSQVLSAHVAQEFWQMPATQEDQLAAIIAGCKERGIQYILPSRDGELLFWAKHKQHLATENIHILSSNQNCLKTCLDKLEFAQLASAKKLSIIPASSYIEDIKADSYVVKERFGAGSHSLGLKLNASQALAHAKQLENPIFQPFIEGEEISIDAWHNRQGQLKGMVMRKRELIIQGESQITSTFSNLKLEHQAQQLLNALPLNGPSVTQAFIDSQQQLHFIECNPRFGGASTASIQVGLHSLKWSLLEAMGQNIEHYPFVRSTSEIRQIRYSRDHYA